MIRKEGFLICFACVVAVERRPTVSSDAQCNCQKKKKKGTQVFECSTHLHERFRILQIAIDHFDGGGNAVFFADLLADQLGALDLFDVRCGQAQGACQRVHSELAKTSADAQSLHAISLEELIPVRLAQVSFPGLKGLNSVLWE